ncbi:acyl-CoA dehydrogenase family protein [Acidisphaera sp. L21]|uniref:acyl-CoA dehydrogenase family protein n=1 Tax=Acidisphaera sp. L21 TaxID=1641851 RepID=UPI00131DA26C|nr:acyl-CoA dehydrogenase family protein [Acidisphaera sp. L21]
MDFDLNDDQRLLKDSVERLITDKYGFDQRRANMAAPGGWSRTMWAQFAELGLLGLPFAEEHGGFGGGPVEAMIVAEAFGRGLVLEPYLATVILGGGLIRRAGDAATQASLLPQIASGELLLAFAHVEPQSRYELHNVATIARQDGARWRLEGDKGVVLHGDCANKILVTARTAGSTRDRTGIGLFLVDVPGEGVSVRGYPTQDGLRAAEVSLAGATGIPLGDPANALPAIERVVDEALAFLAAEAVGVMAAMHASTVDYMKQRKQFGRAIGDFQALQHRAVDMLVLLEQARSMALLATMMVAEDDPVERHKVAAAAKVQIGRSGRKLGQEAVQLHGGIGVTMEYMVGHYFKRMSMIEILFGDADTHLAQLAEGSGVLEAA